MNGRGYDAAFKHGFAAKAPNIQAWPIAKRRMTALDACSVIIGGHDMGESLFNDLGFHSSLGTSVSFLLPASCYFLTIHILLESQQIQAQLPRMSHRRNKPPPQKQFQRHRCKCGLEHLPALNSDHERFDKMSRERYQATHNSAQSSTSDSRPYDRSIDRPTSPNQLSTPQDGIYGPRPPRTLAHTAKVGEGDSNRTLNSVPLIPSFDRPPIQTNDHHVPFDQRTMVGDRPLNDASHELQPPRSFGERERGNPSTDYNPSSHPHGHFNQGHSVVANRPASSMFPPGMLPGREKSICEGVYPSGHSYRCSCPDCIAVTTVRLDREKAEREQTKRRKVASRLDDCVSYNDGPSRYRDADHQQPRIDAQYGRSRPPLNEPLRPPVPPLPPLIARPDPPQLVDRIVPTHNVDLGISSLTIDDSTTTPPRQRRPDPRHSRHLDSRRRAWELL